MTVFLVVVVVLVLVFAASVFGCALGAAAKRGDSQVALMFSAERARRGGERGEQ